MRKGKQGSSDSNANRDRRQNVEDVLAEFAGHRQERKRQDKAIEIATLGRVLRLVAQADKAESKFDRLGIVKDIDEAIEYRRQALSLAPDQHETRPSLLGALGSSFWSRYERAGDLADLNKAIEHLTQAVQLAPDSNPDKLTALGGLGMTYESRFQRCGELVDLNRAIDYKTQAALLTLDGHPRKPGQLSNLGNSYQSRFERFGELSDLHKAIEYKSQSVLLAPDGHPDKNGYLSNLGISYATRFARLGGLADLNKALDHLTQGVLLTPDGSPKKSGRLNNLGLSFHLRFGRIGELADLNKAIEYQTEAVVLTPDGHPDKDNRLSNLGNSYQSRFGRLGELSDLNKAIGYKTQAVELTPDGHAHKHRRLNNLGNSYQSRFVRLGDLGDLNNAIKYQTQAVLLTPDGHADKPGGLNNLGNSYESRFKRLGKIADLTKAIEHQTHAVLLTADGDAARHTRINNLGRSYQSRFDRLGWPEDVKKAIEFHLQAVLLTPAGHPEKPNCFYNLGNSYRSRFKHLGDRSDLQIARALFQLGAQLSLAHPQIQSSCARAWAKCCLSLDSSPQSAYERCMELIPHFIWLGTTINQRYALLREINDLAAEAAAWAISVNDFSLAPEWLEEGRSIVWNQILQLRTPFDELFLVDPALAQDLKDTSSELETAGSSQLTPFSDNVSSSLEKEAQQRHNLARKWEQLLEKARTIPGFERFLRPPKAYELIPSATAGPVVVLNAHPTRCDALILFPRCETISHLSLPNCSLAKLGEARVQLQSLVGHRGERAGGLQRSKPPPNLQDTFKSILATCWSDIVQPVLDVLACKHEVPAEEQLHVTWCATGALSFLPLHAAGLYDGLQPNASDLIVSSYTPTLNALLITRTPDPSNNRGVLGVGQEHTRGFCSLPGTVHELAAIKEAVKATSFQQLDGSSATVDAVLDAMEKHSWAHLACHATQSLDNPVQSAFHLYDGPLTLDTITKRSFKNKGLAFLSACQTAAGDEKLADEAVHLAAGVLMAGYPSVIATMWSIQDEDGPKIAEVVYADLLKDGRMDHRQAARALHKAVVGLREEIGDDAFERWVPFIHIGV